MAFVYLYVRAWASAAGGGGACPPWIFIHGTNIADRGLKVLFSAFLCYFAVLFFRCPPPLDEAK